MDRPIITVNLTLSVVFLIAGVIVLTLSDHDIGAGLIGTATGLALGTGTHQVSQAVQSIRNGNGPPAPGKPV